MGDRMQGTVVAVVSEAQGGVCLSWQGTQMLVADASDFSREGGQLTIDPGTGAQVVNYIGVTEGESVDDPDVVITVEQGSVADECRVDLLPLAWDVTAEVQTDTDDSVPCVVPHMLRPLLADGIRELDRENVWIERRGQQWVVADVVGRAYDRLIYDREGNPVGGFDEDGNGIAQKLDVGQITVAGEDLWTLLAPMQPQVLRLPSNSAKAGTAEVGVCDIGITANPGRLYRIQVDGYWLVPPGERAQVFIRARTAGDGIVDVPAPTISTAASVDSTIVPGHARGGNARGGLTTWWVSDYTQPSGVRFLLSMQALDSATGVGTGTGGWMVVTDEGVYDGSFADGQLNTAGGAPVSGASVTPSNSRVTYTSVWRADWTQSWRGGSLVTDALGQGRWDNIQRYSTIGFTGKAISGEVGKTLAQALTGASVARAEFQATNVHFPSNTGGNLVVGYSGVTGPTGSPITSGTNPVTYSWAKGSRKYVTLPGAWNPRWAASIRSLVLGEGAGSNPANYAKWKPDPATLLLKITYTR